LKGDKGDLGPQGYNGIPGLKGDLGPVGPQGRSRSFNRNNSAISVLSKNYVVNHSAVIQSFYL